MKHLVILAHPNEGSFNHAVLETTVSALKARGHEVEVRDLYAVGFNPVLSAEDFKALRQGQTPADIKTEQDYFSAADVVTFIYPIWWSGLPAILKGYIDRVFSYGFAYAYNEAGGIDQLLQGKKGFIINTHGALNETYDQIGMTAALRQTSDGGIFSFVGLESVDHLFFGGIGETDDAARKDILRQVEARIAELF